MSEEQYNAMTPEQQAAYWHQWQQYSAQQYYTTASDPQQQQQHDPSVQYAQYAQYQVKFPAGSCTERDLLWLAVAGMTAELVGTICMMQPSM